MVNPETNTSKNDMITDADVPSNESVQTQSQEQDNILERVPAEIMGRLAINIHQFPTEEQHIDVHRDGGKFGQGIEPLENPGPTAYNQANQNNSLPDHLIVINK